MNEFNSDYENLWPKLDQFPIGYHKKVEIFENNLKSMLKTSAFITRIAQENLNDLYELLKNKNAIVPFLPVFKYDNKVMCMAKSQVSDDFEHGKYEILTVDEINEFLNNNYLVFIYTVSDQKYNETDKLKYRTVILRDIEITNEGIKS